MNIANKPVLIKINLKPLSNTFLILFVFRATILQDGYLKGN
jgi:hypothetical protein